MRKYLDILSDFRTITGAAASSADETWAKVLINQAVRRIWAMQDWNFARANYTYTSVASQQGYNIPVDCQKVRGVTGTLNSVKYVPEEVTNGTLWTLLNNVTVNSDIPQKWYFSNASRNIQLYPIPSSTSLSIKIHYTKKIFDTAWTADYTTGTITVSAGGTTVTGSGTTFTSGMVGRYIQYSNAGYWYEITGFTSTTSITVREPASAAVSGANYTISEMVPLPDGFEDMPLWWTLWTWYTRKENVPKMAEMYKKSYQEELEELGRRDTRSSRKILAKDDLTIIGGLRDINKYPRDLA